jgi:hypothetical protein
LFVENFFTFAAVCLCIIQMKPKRVMVDLKFQALDFHAARALPMDIRILHSFHIRVREMIAYFFKKQYSLFQKFSGQGGFCYNVNHGGQRRQPGQNEFLS